MSELHDAFEAYVPRLARERFLPSNPAAAEASAEALPGCVLLADVSGFTPLLEQLSLEPSRGAELAQETLNGIFGALVDGIQAWGGDILRFPGDAALALWPAAGAEELTLAVRRAIHCALDAQAALERLEVRGTRLRLRIGVGAGTVWAARVGGVEGRWELLVRGKPFEQLADALAQAEPGQVVLSPEAALLAEGFISGRAKGRCVQVEHATEPVLPASSNPLPPAEKAALLAFVPRVVQARLDAGQRDWLAEFRWATVAFVGLPGLDPEAADTLDRVQDAVRAVQVAAYRFGGSLNQVVEDEKGTTLVLAFGVALRAHEDDPLRAVRAALEISQQLAQLGLAARIGVATARLFMGRRGGSGRVEYGLVGSGMNRAARLTQQAAPILCDAATRAATRRRVIFASLPPLHLKGVAGPVRAYRPHALRPAQAPLIGRHAERELLDRCLRALEVSGHGATIYLEGEAGIGKSRLVAYLLEQARATSVRALVGHADAIEQTTHYHVWRPVLAELLGPEAARDAATLRERLAAMLDADSLSRAPLLGSLLPIPLPETPQTLRMEPQGRAEAARELLVAILERAVQRAPLLLVLEDAHWMDSGSWEIARLARERLPRLLLVVCARPMGPGLPEEAQRLRAAASVQRVVLDVLEPDEALALVCERLDVDSLPEAVARFVQQRAEGHPFFTEELTHSLRDHGLIAVEAGECTLVGSVAQLERLDLPETVQGVVTTRIDHLDPRQELTLKVASVLGRRFSVSDVSSVHPLEAEWEAVAGQLTAVAELGLVVAEPADQYRFKHAIVQETAYRLLPFAQRCELHRRMAELLERTRAADLAPCYPLLAHHWREAGDLDKQRNYLGLAGERALLRDYANTEAAQFLSELLALGDPQGELGARVAIALPDGRRLAPEAVERARRERLLGEALMNLGRHAEGWPHMERALNGFGEALPRSRFSLVSSVVLELAALLLRKPSALPRRTPPEPARAVLAEIVRTWERIGIAAYSRGVSQQGITSTSQGVLALGILALLRAVKAAWAMGASPELAQALATFSNVPARLRLDRLADRYSDAALEVASRVNDPAARAFALARGSLHRLARGRFEVDKSLDEALAIWEELGNHYMWEETASTRGMLALLCGDTAASRTRFAAVVARSRRSGSVVHELWGLVGEADASLRLGAIDDAIALAQEALALHERSGSRDETTPFLAAGVLASAWLRKEGPERSAGWAERAMGAMTAAAREGYGALAGFVGIAEHHLAAWERGDVADGPHERALRSLCRAMRGTARYRPLLTPALHRIEGGIAWRRGRRAQAFRSWQRGLERARALGLRFEAAAAALAIGGHLPAGDARRTDHLEQAAAGFDAVEASLEAYRARELATR